MRKTNRLITILIFIFLYAPMIVLILASFNTGKDITEFEGFTFGQYAELFRDRSLLTLLGNSLIISILSKPSSINSIALSGIGLNGHQLGILLPINVARCD